MNLPTIITNILKFSVLITLIILVVCTIIVLFIYMMRAFDNDFENQKKFLYRFFHKASLYTILKYHSTGTHIDVKDGDFVVTLRMDYENTKILRQLISNNPDAIISFSGIVNKRTMTVVYVKGFSLKKKGE